MKLDITGRNIDVTPAIKDFALDKLSKLNRWIDEIIEVHIILSVEKHRHSAEILVKTRHDSFTGSEETGDMYASIGNAVDKLEKQARRSKEKHRTRRKHARSTAEFPVDDDGQEPYVVDEVDTGLADVPRIIRMNGFNMKPMSMEDAALKLVDSEREFLVYRDARSQQIRVIYRRKDGNLGLIEPDA